MTKTKRQSRAEAAGRLKKFDPVLTDEGEHLAILYQHIANTGALGFDDEQIATFTRDALIDLLSEDPLPEGDPVSIMRDCAEGSAFGASVNLMTCVFGEDADEHSFNDALLEIADMVERDYVRRDVHEEAAEIWFATVDEHAQVGNEAPLLAM